MQPTPAAISCVQGLVAAAMRFEEGEASRADSVLALARARAGVGPADLLEAAVRHRVTDVLHAHAETLGVGEAFGDGVVRWLAEAHAATSRGIAVQALELDRVLGAFGEAGVRALVLKGAALAVQSAGDAGARGVGDLDLFVATESVERARSIMLRHGWRPRPVGSATPGTWAWRHVLRTFNEITFDGRASTVDLHWRLDMTPAVLPDFDECWDRRQVVRLTGAVDVPTLGWRDAFVHSSWHAAKDEWRWLRSLVDVHRLARQPDLWAEWEQFTGWHVLQTIAVTADVLELPGAVPLELRQRARQQRASIRRARARQLRAPVASRPFPAAMSVRNLRHRLRAAHGPRALGLALSAAAIPAYAVAGIEDRTAWRAVPRLLLRRVLWLTRWAVTWATGPPSPVPGSALRTNERSDTSTGAAV